MIMLKLYNTLTRKIEEFEPIDPPLVGMYSCGPTVYDFQHIGHMRRYVGDDILVRTLKYHGYTVKHVMNITDVGHLVSDGDTGEDKMEKGARKFGGSVWDVARRFEEQFIDSLKLLDIQLPDVLVRATERIEDQIDLIKILEEKGVTYITSDGVYFDASQFPNYSKLSGQDPEELRAGARVDMGEKINPTDFALWKFSPKGEKRQMEWESPWGVGFPGWHIECSAMSMRELGATFDIHTGGIDHIPVHHTNEIAQSEAASGREFVKFWVHHNFLMVESQKMSKSIGNIFTVQDMIEKKYNPMALRYLYLQTHYRQEMNFTWEALDGAVQGLNVLYEKAGIFGENPSVQLNKEPSKKMMSWLVEFEDAIYEDLNTPKAIAVLHRALKERDGDPYDVMFLLTKADEILGLEFRKNGMQLFEKNIPLDPYGDLSPIEKEVVMLSHERDSLRKGKSFDRADQIRRKINEMGYDVVDFGDQYYVKKI